MQLSALISLLRPKQWIKNGFVFAPLVFAQRFEEPQAWWLSALAALSFLCAACAVYIANDLLDIAEDRQHPVKRHRPLAAGTVRPGSAIALLILFLLMSVLISLNLPVKCTVVIVIYLILNLTYTLSLKHVALLDVMSVASCYVLRVLMGCYVLQVEVSPWIILATFLLALFLCFSKRYHESGIAEYAEVKANLQHYSRDLLDRLMTICACAALLVYAIYAAEMALALGRMEFVYTTGFVAFGLFRYLQQVHVFKRGGEPEFLVFKDRLQQANIILWLLTCLCLMG